MKETSLTHVRQLSVVGTRGCLPQAGAVGHGRIRYKLHRRYVTTTSGRGTGGYRGVTPHSLHVPLFPMIGPIPLPPYRIPLNSTSNSNRRFVIARKLLLDASVVNG